ncbi:MAG: ABC transporter substrate-binding protein [Thermomicrobiales bacterium]|nr:ABC transporter substrate-binding protein [Thermomicrobiales bacterium]
MSTPELNKLRTIELDRRKLLLGALASGAVLPIAYNSATGASVYAQASEDGGTLIFNNGTNPSGLDPHIAGAVASWYVMDQVFDRLLRLDPETSEPGPSLAESYEVSEDGLTYTFNLRSGVTFSNGRELTSDDVKWSFERIMDPEVPAVAKGYFSALDSIETPDASTVILNYTEPFAPLLLALCRLETSILPQEAVEDTATWEVAPIGSGPFIIESNVKDQSVVLVRNENYWEEGLPYLARVEHRIIPQAETAVANIRTGDIHGTEVAAKDIESLADNEGVNVELLTSSLWPHLSVNTSVAPFDNLQVRQAIRCGFNRDDIMQAAFYGTGMISNTMLPEGNPYRAEVDGWAYDPDRAKQLMADAGYADGFSVTMRIVPAVAWEPAAAQIIQAYLSELNINIEIEQIESTTWFSEVFTNSEFEMSMTAHSSKVDPDLSMLDILHSGELGTKNYTRFSDPEMDELLDQGRGSTNPDERMETYAKAQEIFVDRSGYFVLNLQEQAWGLRDNVQDFTMLPWSELRWKETQLS